MKLDVTSIVLLLAAAVLGVFYFVRRSNRMKRAHRKL